VTNTLWNRKCLKPFLEYSVEEQCCKSLGRLFQAGQQSYRKASNKRPRRLLEHWPRLLMSVVPISPVYVNFTLHMLILSVYTVYIYLVR